MSGFGEAFAGSQHYLARDASNQALLERRHPGDCDALITISAWMSRISFLYGNNRGVPQVITKGRTSGSHQDYRESSHRKYCESERSYQCNRTLRGVYNQEGADYGVRYRGWSGRSTWNFVEKDTRYCGVPLKNMETKKNILIAGISHKARTEVPDGESRSLRWAIR